MMTHKQFREAIDALGMTLRGGARFLGIGERSSRRYADDGDIPQTTELLLKIMIAKKITPEEAFKIVGLKLPKEGFADRRVVEE